MTPTLEQRVAALEDRIAISELRSRYCWYTVRGLRDAVVELFTEDGVFENARNAGEAPVSVTGHDALRAHFAPMQPARRIPLVTNEVTRLDGDQAQGTCAMVSIGDDGFCGHYIDDFRRVDGQWRFSARRFFPYWPVFRPDAGRSEP